MRASFIHVADTHLGFEQYAVRERFHDFFRAFKDIAEQAVERHVDFVVIAGDFFHKRAIDPLTLVRAVECLHLLSQAGIPVLAIAGNHDRSYYRNENFSWLEYLARQGHLITLDPLLVDGNIQIAPWSRETLRGAYYDLLDGRLRVYGLPWRGLTTDRSIINYAQMLEEVREQESEVEYRLMMLHTGLEGEVPHVQGLPSMSTFEHLKGKVDYLALGHVHKPYEYGGWLYNPGSPEHTSIEEIRWPERGYYLVQIDTETPETIIDPEKKERVHHAQRLVNRRRSFLRIEIRVEGFDDPAILFRHIEEQCQRQAQAYKQNDKPVVIITLKGTLAFHADVLDRAAIEAMVERYFDPIHTHVDNQTHEQDYEPGEDDIGLDRSRWREVELRVLTELIARDNRYLAKKEAWGKVISEIKQQVLEHEDPAQIARFLREKHMQLFEESSSALPETDQENVDEKWEE